MKDNKYGFLVRGGDGSWMAGKVQWQQLQPHLSARALEH